MEISRSQYELKKILQHRLAEIQANNPQYSLRAFAKSLGIYAASLSEFFNDKRQFSPKLQKKIIEKLAIDPLKKNKLASLLDNPEEISRERVQIDTDYYYLVKDPIYYSILSLIETYDFKEDYTWISKRLRKKKKEVKDAFQRLERVGYIKRLENGKIVIPETNLDTTDDVANMSLRLRHAENLDNAKEALLNLPVEERYFIFETLPINKEDMPEFKKAVRDFQSKIISISQKSQKKNEVYEFSLNFFPRSY